MRSEWHIWAALIEIRLNIRTKLSQALIETDNIPMSDGNNKICKFPMDTTQKRCKKEYEKNRMAAAAAAAVLAPPAAVAAAVGAPSASDFYDCKHSEEEDFEEDVDEKEGNKEEEEEEEEMNFQRHILWATMGFGRAALFVTLSSIFILLVIPPPPSPPPPLLLLLLLLLLMAVLLMLMLLKQFWNCLCSNWDASLFGFLSFPPFSWILFFWIF